MSSRSSAPAAASRPCIARPAERVQSFQPDQYGRVFCYSQQVRLVCAWFGFCDWDSKVGISVGNSGSFVWTGRGGTNRPQCASEGRVVRWRPGYRMSAWSPSGYGIMGSQTCPIPRPVVSGYRAQVLNSSPPTSAPCPSEMPNISHALYGRIPGLVCGVDGARGLPARRFLRPCFRACP